MIIPRSAERDVQSAFREIWTVLQPLVARNKDLGGRRIMNAGDSIAPTDYVTRFELNKDLNGVAVEIKKISLDTIPTALSLIKSIRVGVYATRGSPIAHAQEIFIASDRNYVGWVSDGAAWKYHAGVEYNTLASIRTGLGTDDAGYQFGVSDYSHMLRWSGSAWVWAPGDPGSGSIQMFLAAPSGFGALAWQICDGSTVARLNADGTTTNVTVPDYSTSAYVKLATTATIGPTAAGGAVANESAHTHAFGTIAVADHASHTHDDASSLATPDLFAPDVTGTGVAGQTGGPDATLTHSVSGATAAGSAHGHAAGTLELRRTEPLAYYRR